MLILYNEPLMINHPIGTAFVCGFQLSNKKEFILCLFELPLVNPLTLTIVLSLFNLFITITSQSSLQHQYHFIICNLYSSPSCGSTSVLSGYLLLWHSYTWDKTSTLWSCHCAIWNVNCHEWLYKYYKGFVTNVYMSIAKNLLMCYT